MAATLVLERGELQQTVDLLKAALAELTTGRPAPSVSAATNQMQQLALAANAQPAAAAAAQAPTAAARAAPPAVPIAAPVSAPPPAALSVPQPRPASLPVVQQPVPVPAAAPMQQPQLQPMYQQPQPQPRAPMQQPMQQPMMQPQPQPQLQPRPVYQQQQPQQQHAPVPAVQVPVVQPQPAYQPQPQQQRQQPPPQQQQRQQQLAAAASPWGPPQAPATAQPYSTPAASTVSTAASAAASRWQHCFSTEPEDHDKKPVTALAYAQSLPGLPGGDGHAGWLVSGSQGTLNLWETNRGTDATEMALLCMHSQAVDVACSKLVLEPATKFLFGAAAHSSKGECISVHSLDAELGLLALRYQFAPPPGRPATSQRLMQQVVSVHGMTPGLRSSIVASYGERLLVFEAKAGVRAHSVLHDATFHFVAHPGSVVTCLHRSAIEGSCSLVSGAANGAVHLWDLKVPPQNNAPALRMLRHSQPVTGLCLVSDDRLASSSMDGSVLLWDLRRPGSPLHTATAPGGVAVLRIAPGPWGDILAVASQAGLHCLELFDFGAPMADITPGPLARPFSDIVFNSVTHDLYAGSSNGSVQVFSRLA